MVDLHPVVVQPVGEFGQVGVVAHLEAHEVHARLVGWPQDHAVMVELVVGLEVLTTVVAGPDMGEADSIAVVLDRSFDVGGADLYIASSHDSPDCHGGTPNL